MAAAGAGGSPPSFNLIDSYAEQYDRLLLSKTTQKDKDIGFVRLSQIIMIFGALVLRKVAGNRALMDRIKKSQSNAQTLKMVSGLVPSVKAGPPKNIVATEAWETINHIKEILTSLGSKLDEMRKALSEGKSITDDTEHVDILLTMLIETLRDSYSKLFPGSNSQRQPVYAELFSEAVTTDSVMHNMPKAQTRKGGRRHYRKSRKNSSQKN